jgi:hypothetical protein
MDLSKDFMTGWGVVAAYIARPGCTGAKARRWVARQAASLTSIRGARWTDEQLRGIRAGLQAAMGCGSVA